MTKTAASTNGSEAREFSRGTNGELICDVCGASENTKGKPFNAHSMAAHHRWHDTGSVVNRGKAPKELDDKRAKAVNETKEMVVNWFVPIQMGLLGSGDTYCAKAIGEEIPLIGTAVGELAEEFPLLKRVVTAGDKWAALGNLAYHVGRLAACVAVHHNLLPYAGPVRFLVPPPPEVVATNPILRQHFGMPPLPDVPVNGAGGGGQPQPSAA